MTIRDKKFAKLEDKKKDDLKSQSGSGFKSGNKDLFHLTSKNGAGQTKNNNMVAKVSQLLKKYMAESGKKMDQVNMDDFKKWLAHLKKNKNKK
mgnify:CR=1 FL=1